MPCNADYMDPTQRERDSREVAVLLHHLARKLGMVTSSELSAAASGLLGDVGRLDEFTAELCSLLRGLNDHKMNLYVYDGRDPMARRLADWWDKHQEADRIREEKESRANRSIDDIVADALSRSSTDYLQEDVAKQDLNEFALALLALKEGDYAENTF